MISEALAYIPEDRRLAISRGVDLPGRATGSALFADISGFTPLTEALVRVHGTRRGADQLLVELNRIYDALVTEVSDRLGSVIVYSGDAMTCWFDDAPLVGTPLSGAERAVACGLAMQEALGRLGAIVVGDDTVRLTVKVAITTGAISRAVVGDPTIQVFDIAAGGPIERLADAEHEAEPGEVIVDEATAGSLVGRITLGDARTGPDGDRYTVVGAADLSSDRTSWPSIDAAIDDAVLRSWLIPPIAARLASGQGEFLTELRPAVSLFLRFDGIDHDHDPDAVDHLDTLVRSTQEVLERYDAYILQVTIGDKGSYINTAFGAPVAVGHDAVRAVSAGLELVAMDWPSVASVQIGIAQGRTRAGACGAADRRCYGVMGDPVNLSARLMQRADDRTILVEGAIRRAAALPYQWVDLDPITVKGKTDRIAVARPIGLRQRNGNRLRARPFGDPMVGRDAEMARIRETFDIVEAGVGRVVAIVGDAGMGKSRLVGEIVGEAEERGFACFGGECQSFGVNASYHVWHAVWRDVFELDAADSVEAQVARIEAHLDEIDPVLGERLPLVGAATNLQIPDNELTVSFDAALRKGSLEALLVEVLRARVRAWGPTLLVIEDCHWLDALSHDLLEAICRAITDLPVLVVCAYRPPEMSRLAAPRIVRLPHTSEVTIDRLDDTSLQQLAQARLAATGSEPDPTLVDAVCSRAEGNPFYVEEMVGFLLDQGTDVADPASLASVEFPDSLHSLILGRMDRLAEDQRTLLKVASVIGRLFQVALLWGIAPNDAGRDRLVASLDELSALDFMSVDVPEPNLAYLFKHVLNQEVAYETLGFATRAAIHEQIGRYIETERAPLVEQHLDLLAHHYDRTENLPKRLEYLGRAGRAAQASYANAAALDYLGRLLVLQSGSERIDTLLRLAAVHETVGDWPAAVDAAAEARDLAESVGDALSVARAARTLSSVARKQGDYDAAIEWLGRAETSAIAAGSDVATRSLIAADTAEIMRLQGRYDDARRRYDDSLLLADAIEDDTERRQVRAHALKGAGSVATWSGDYDLARRLNDEAIALRRELGDVAGLAVMLNNQGIIDRFVNDLAAARRLNNEAIALFRDVGDRWSTGQLLNNQACVAADQGDYGEAVELLEECLEIRRRLGDKAGLNLSLVTLADVLVDTGRIDDARPVIHESLALCLELSDRTMLAYLLEDIAAVEVASGRIDSGLRCLGYATALREEIGAPLPPNEEARVNRLTGPARAGSQHPDVPVSAGADLARRGALDALFA